MARPTDGRAFFVLPPPPRKGNDMFILPSDIDNAILSMLDGKPNSLAKIMYPEESSLNVEELREVFPDYC